MDGKALLIFILVVTAIIVGATLTACYFFMRFMRKEKELGKRNEEIHGTREDRRPDL